MTRVRRNTGAGAEHKLESMSIAYLLSERAGTHLDLQSCQCRRELLGDRRLEDACGQGDKVSPKMSAGRQELTVSCPWRTPSQRTVA